jgi:DNA-binding MarR family transcriptional regulator
LAITVRGTSKLVDRIEASGYCRRRPDPDDGRSSIIELSGAGRRLLKAATDTVEGELADRLASAVSARALQQFTGTLAKLRLANNRATSTARMTRTTPQCAQWDRIHTGLRYHPRWHC